MQGSIRSALHQFRALSGFSLGLSLDPGAEQQEPGSPQQMRIGAFEALGLIHQVRHVPVSPNPRKHSKFSPQRRFHPEKIFVRVAANTHEFLDCVGVYVLPSELQQQRNLKVNQVITADAVQAVDEAVQVLFSAV
jgi:hypothetical protein